MLERLLGTYERVALKVHLKLDLFKSKVTFSSWNVSPYLCFGTMLLQCCSTISKGTKNQVKKTQTPHKKTHKINKYTNPRRTTINKNPKPTTSQNKQTKRKPQQQKNPNKLNKKPNNTPSTLLETIMELNCSWRMSSLVANAIYLSLSSQGQQDRSQR